MGEQLIKVYGVSIPNEKFDYNLDNLYMNGKYIVKEQKSQTFSYSSNNKSSIQIYAVCDGLEESNSEDASVPTTAVMQVLKVLQKRLGEEEKLTIGRARRMIQDFIVDTNNKISLYKQSIGKMDLGATFAALFIFGNKAFTVHLGDSRVYLYKHSQLQQLTNDHLESISLVKLGILSEEQADIHKSRSKLTKYFGYEDEEYELSASFSSIFTINQGDILLLSTDGVTDVLKNNQIEEIIRSNNKDEVILGKGLINEANNKFKDRTLMVLNVDEVLNETIIREDQSNNFLNQVQSQMPTLQLNGDSKKKAIGIIVGVVASIILLFTIISAISSVLDKDQPAATIQQEQSGGEDIQVIDESSIPEPETTNDNEPSTNEQTTNDTTQTDESSTEDQSTKDENNNNENGNSDSVNILHQSSVPSQYIVQKGDNLFNIAMNFYDDSSMVEKIMYLNNLEDRNQIFQGQKLILPSENKMIEYKVQTGETFFSISQKFYSSNRVDEIMKLNSISDENDLVAGTVILIP